MISLDYRDGRPLYQQVKDSLRRMMLVLTTCFASSMALSSFPKLQKGLLCIAQCFQFLQHRRQLLRQLPDAALLLITARGGKAALARHGVARRSTRIPL